MQEFGQNIFTEDKYPGVILGAIVSARGTVLIDAPLKTEDCHMWSAAVLKRTGTHPIGNDPNFHEHVLIYMDAHPDRTIGAKTLENTGQVSVIIAHHDAAKRFEQLPTTFKGQNPDSGAEWETCDEVISTRWALPVMTFTKEMHLNWNHPGLKVTAKQTGQVILEHHPGPSAGAIWVHIPEYRIIFIGDAVCAHQPPFLETADIPSWLDLLESMTSNRYRGYTFLSSRSGFVHEKDILTQRDLLLNIQEGLSAWHAETPPLTIVRNSSRI
jgi:glyoxylase-like metal-dependent hydrolase (beta-lactamase superfamily II)